MRYLIVILLCFAFNANGQIIRANPFHTRRAVAVVTDTLLLDSFPNAVVGYSFRKLRSSYTGSAIRVRRDSTGNAETDIGFVNNYIDTVALKNHCRNNSCMITTWYSQGDSAFNFTQTTAASQPRIVNAGTIERSDGQVSIRFDQSNDFMDIASSTASMSFIHKTGQKALFYVVQYGLSANPAGTLVFINNNNTAGANTGYSFYFNDAAGSNDRLINQGTPTSFNMNKDSFALPNELALYSNILDNGNATANQRAFVYKNGGNGFNTNAGTGTPSVNNATNNFRMGRQSGGLGSPFGGFVSEIIIYNSNQSSNRTSIENNINRNWLIY